MYRRVELDPETRRGGGDELLTAAEVAELLRMTPAWVYEETRRNLIPHMRLGRYFRYRRSAIESWMSEIETGPMPKKPKALTAARRRHTQASLFPNSVGAQPASSVKAAARRITQP
jgi:excisionase family DNA binding protein